MRSINCGSRLVVGPWLAVLLLLLDLTVVNGFAAAKISKARVPQDLPQIRTCRLTAFDRAVLLNSEQDFVNATSVAQGRNECFVARNGNSIVGTADFKMTPGSRSVLVLNVFVTPESRGQGLAKQMMQAIQDEAKSRGAQKLTLEVYTNNVPAYTLYQRDGFVTKGVHAGMAQLSKATGFSFLVEMEKALT